MSTHFTDVTDRKFRLDSICANCGEYGAELRPIGPAGEHFCASCAIDPRMGTARRVSRDVAWAQVVLPVGDRRKGEPASASEVDAARVILERARTAIEQRYWSPLHNVDREGQMSCTGALNFAANEDPDDDTERPGSRLATETLRCVMGWPQFIEDWDAVYGRERKDALAAFTRALDQLGKAAL